MPSVIFSFDSLLVRLILNQVLNLSSETDDKFIASVEHTIGSTVCTPFQSEHKWFGMTYKCFSAQSFPETIRKLYSFPLIRATADNIIPRRF